MNNSASTRESVAITLNGEVRKVVQGTMVAELLHSMQLEARGRGVAVAVNDSLIRKPEWATTEINEGDTVEVVTARQGG